MTDMPMPTTVPELRVGDDLRLRAHRANDLAAIVEQARDPAMQQWTTVPAPYGEADARGFLDHLAEGWATATVAGFAVELDGRFAGTVDLRMQEADWAETGFGLSPWARGHHVMRRSLARAVQWGFDEAGLAGVSWLAQVGNTASLRVAQACGFRLEGTVRGLIVQRGVRVDAWIGTLLAGDPRPGFA